MGEIVKIKKSSKKSESSKFWGKNQKIFVHPRTELRTPRALAIQLSIHRKDVDYRPSGSDLFTSSLKFIIASLIAHQKNF